MKTAFACVVLALVLLAFGGSAQASSSNWMLYLATDSLDGTDFGVNANVGVKPAASDLLDTYDGSPVDFGTSSNTTKWAVNSLAGDAYSKNFMSTASYTTYPNWEKKWSFRVAGLTGATGDIRFRFKTGTSTATLPPQPINPAWEGWSIRLVNNRGKTVLRPNWASSPGAVWPSGQYIDFDVPTTTNTYFGELDLPLLKLSTDSNAAMLTEGYSFEFMQWGTIPEPGSLLALSAGLVGLAGLVIRRRRS